MNEQNGHGRDGRFLLMGLVAGGVLGAGLTMLMAPRAAAEIKARALGSVRDLGATAAGRYRDARLRVAGAVDSLTRTGQDLRDDACDTVVRGARGVERGAKDVQRFATEAKTDA
jgi:hypothetical protein